MAEDVKIYVSETVERVEIKVSDPFPTNVLPTGTLEINDVKANTLSSAETGGSIPPEIYSWFKDKFALLVDKLLSSWVHGLIFITKAIDEALTSLQSTVSEHVKRLEVIDGRLDAIDDKLIVNYVVPVDTTAIELTVDKNGNAFNFVEGDIVEVLMYGKSDSTGFYNALFLRPNNVYENEYYYNGTSKYSAFLGYLAYYFINRWQLYINADNVYMFYTANRTDSSFLNYVSNNFSMFSKPVSEGGHVIPPITRLYFYSGYTISAGTVIIIRKIR